MYHPVDPVLIILEVFSYESIPCTKLYQETLSDIYVSLPWVLYVRGQSVTINTVIS